MEGAWLHWNDGMGLLCAARSGGGDVSGNMKHDIMQTSKYN